MHVPWVHSTRTMMTVLEEYSTRRGSLRAPETLIKYTSSCLHTRTANEWTNEWVTGWMNRVSQTFPYVHVPDKIDSISNKFRYAFPQMLAQVPNNIERESCCSSPHRLVLLLSHEIVKQVNRPTGRWLRHNSMLTHMHFLLSKLRSTYHIVKTDRPGASDPAPPTA